MSVYKSKFEQLKEQAAYASFKLKNEAYKAKYTAGVMAWAAMDINERMASGHQRAFGKKRR